MSSRLRSADQLQTAASKTRRRTIGLNLISVRGRARDEEPAIANTAPPPPPPSGHSISFQSYFRWADLNSQADICQPEDEEKYLVVEINRTVFSSKTLISLGFLFCFEQGKCKII